MNMHIISNTMEETVVVRNRGGSCLVKNPSLFSPDGKYIYIASDKCVSAYSVQTGECTHKFVNESKEAFVSLAIYKQSLLSVTSSGFLTVWRTNDNSEERNLNLALGYESIITSLYGNLKLKNKIQKKNGSVKKEEGKMEVIKQNNVAPDQEMDVELALDEAKEDNHVSNVELQSKDKMSSNEKDSNLINNKFSQKRTSDQLKQEVVEIHAISSRNKNKKFELVVKIRGKDKKYCEVLVICGSSGKIISNTYNRAADKPQSVSVCDDFVATINQERITVTSLNKDGKKSSTLAGQGRYWTVVAVAPSGHGVAAGDNTGRVVYWHNPFLLQTKTVFHWHTLPVNAVTFSASGSYMYTGGGEGVMVRWNIEATNLRHFLPRLPAPILHLSVSPDNEYVAIATQDNGIQLANAQNKICCVIQSLAWGVTSVAGAPLFPAGLNWDPRTRSIVLNGRPGHLQFFHTDTNKLLYNLDITGQNYLSQEREKVVINCEVTHVAMSSDGKWLVTVETRDDQQAFLETLLKFWQYKFNARQFSLNTCVQLPHQGRVNRIRFQMAGLAPDHYLLVTTGADGKFRMWSPSRSESIHSEGLRWVCDSIGSYRALPAECITFSSDGSILGITFGYSLTLWDSEVCELNTSITRDCNTLRAAEFGSHECCHLVVTASDLSLNVWSILSLYMVWTVPVCTSLLCADPLSSSMALFTTDNSVFVFLPSSPKLLFEKKNLCESSRKVISAIFVPRLHKLLDTNTEWCSNSQLHFIDDNQELRYLELSSEQDPEKQEVYSTGAGVATTPFSILAAKQSMSQVDPTLAVSHDQLGTAREAAVRKLLKNPAHTMPHIKLFCGSFLKSLAINRKSEGEETVEEINYAVKVGDNIKVDGKSKVLASKIAMKKKRSRARPKKTNEKPGESESVCLPHNENQEISSNQRHKKYKRKRQNKRVNSFKIEDLDNDWLSVLEQSSPMK